MSMIQKLKDCKGCAKRRDWLGRQATKVKALFRPRTVESNAARTIVENGSPRRRRGKR